MSQEDIHEKIKKLSNRVTAAQTRVQDKTTELNRLKKQGKKAFDFSKVKEVGKVNKYHVFSY